MKTVFGITAILLFVCGPVAVKAQSLDHVLMNNGTKKFGIVELRNPLTKSPFLTIDTTLRIELTDVQGYQTADGYFRKRFTGDLLDKDNFIFLKKTTTGKVDLYSSVSWSTEFNPVTAQNILPVLKTAASAEYVSKSGYNVLDVDYDNLRELLADNVRSMQMLDEYETLNYYTYGAGGVGTLLVLSGASKDINRGKNYFIAGAACFSIAWIPHLLQQTILQDAITEYNK